jgi:hypothetical protein
MISIPKKVEDRLASGLKRFQAILNSAKSRDVNESDTVIIITDLLGELLGYDKYAEISSEHAIRGTSCDLAMSIDGKVQFLIEAKAIGLDLKDSHVVQAVGYAANKGVDWVVLTNGVNWRIYKVSFGKPIDQELVFEIDFLNLSLKNDDDLRYLYLITKEGWQKQVMVDFAVERQALNRFFIAGLVLSDPVLDVIRRELRRTCPDVRVKNEQIQTVLLQEVLKRDVVEGEKADEARKKILRVTNRLQRLQDANSAPEVRPPILPQASPGDSVAGGPSATAQAG